MILYPLYYPRLNSRLPFDEAKCAANTFLQKLLLITSGTTKGSHSNQFLRRSHPPDPGDFTRVTGLSSGHQVACLSTHTEPTDVLSPEWHLSLSLEHPGTNTLDRKYLNLTCVVHPRVRTIVSIQHLDRGNYTGSGNRFVLNFAREECMFVVLP